MCSSSKFGVSKLGIKRRARLPEPRTAIWDQELSVELYEPHKVQWITRAWSSFSSARIRRAPQFPHAYSSVGLIAFSNGGAWTAAPMTSGSGMTLSVFCGRSDISQLNTQHPASLTQERAA